MPTKRRAIFQSSLERPINSAVSVIASHDLAVSFSSVCGSPSRRVGQIVIRVRDAGEGFLLLERGLGRFPAHLSQHDLVGSEAF